MHLIRGALGVGADEGIMDIGGHTVNGHNLLSRGHVRIEGGIVGRWKDATKEAERR